MLLAAAITFFILKQKKKFILLLLSVMILFIILASPFFYIDNLDLFRIHSGVSRIGDIQKGFTIFKDHPVVGVGFNSYRYAQVRYHFENPNVPIASHSASGTDNSFVFILATSGIIGLLAYGYLWYRMLIKAKESKSKYKEVFFASAVGLLINSLFNNSLFYPEIMLWMWIIAGLLYAKD
jgi:putative inorganic carbon (hco3(-)) transporter